jgi:hypothetical protein
MLSILQNELEKKDISYTKLTGTTKKREEVIEKFTSGHEFIDKYCFGLSDAMCSVCCLIFDGWIPPRVIMNNFFKPSLNPAKTRFKEITN